jgi:hypothetical protein
MLPGVLGPGCGDAGFSKISGWVVYIGKDPVEENVKGRGSAVLHRATEY